LCDRGWRQRCPRNEASRYWNRHELWKVHIKKIFNHFKYFDFCYHSDVAKDSASVILLTNDFTAIVHGVEEGRLIFSNLRKVIGYQIAAGCFAELIPVLATFFLGIPQPLSPFLMIIVSCLTDVYAGK